MKRECIEFGGEANDGGWEVCEVGGGEELGSAMSVWNSRAKLINYWIKKNTTFLERENRKETRIKRVYTKK